MKITKVIIDEYTPQDLGTCGVATIIIDNILAVHKIRIISGEKGLFIAMPNTGEARIVDSKKKYNDIVHPISKGLNSVIVKEVLTAYNNYKPKESADRVNE